MIHPPWPVPAARVDAHRQNMTLPGFLRMAWSRSVCLRARRRREPFSVDARTAGSSPPALPGVVTRGVRAKIIFDPGAVHRVGI